ncbi:DUF1517 domain-containing protein [Deinococcus humi]|uniref:Putative membrane protein n=1 Tax=Deinococcus humi TaxID=662880 RepID=A0A7W8JYG7_9DEIO|nr:DUF1517 domain-containing protein [Deinococcus humi]MBB5365290.1 putative membrane protein [Deinococcus humi]GGO35917.1 hypothetical protein GCM10008949_39140 [Deinococcus humi]
MTTIADQLPVPLLRSLRVLPLLSALLLGGALGVTGGGFGGTTAHPAPAAAPPPGRPASVPSSTYSTSSPAPAGPQASATSTAGTSWGLVVGLGVVGALLAFGFVCALYEEGAGQPRGAQAVRVQVLFENGENVKRQLQLLARRHDPDAPGALATLLRESALLLLRHKADWAYGTAERRAAPGENEANSLVGQWATAARAAFETQTTSQYQNGDVAGGHEHVVVPARTGGLYLAVTLAVSATGLEAAQEMGGPARDVEAALLALSSVGSEHLLRLEAVWSPDGEGEFLSETQAILRYPTLAPL